MGDIEVEKKETFIELGDAGIGTIEAGPDQQDRLEEFTERVASGEFHVRIEWSAAFRKMLLVRCVDGRIPEGGMAPLGPNSAGGTESLFVADDLTTKRFASEDGSTLGGYTNVVKFLVDAGYEVGGHTDTHAHGDASGCGANDKLDKIYRYIDEHRETLRAVAARFGVRVTDETHALIANNASARTQFSKGSELLGVLKESAKEEFVDVLEGDHKEVIAVLNTVPGTTLDRDALVREFGPDYEAFNVDVWAFEEAARATSLTAEEVAQKVAALVYYNLATAMVLSGKKMRAAQVEYALAA